MTVMGIGEPGVALLTLSPAGISLGMLGWLTWEQEMPTQTFASEHDLVQHGSQHTIVAQGRHSPAGDRRILLIMYA